MELGEGEDEDDDVPISDITRKHFERAVAVVRMGNVVSAESLR